MDQVARVVVGLEAQEVVEEVMHFLDRSGRARVVATAGDDRQLAEAIRQLEPDAVVAEPSLLGGANGGIVLAVDTRESVASLRAAIQAGAEGYFVWPGERDALVGAAAAAVRRPRGTTGRAAVVAVHGGRGGVGVTFVAANLAAAFARRGPAILIDAVPVFDDVSQALGAPDDEEAEAEPVHTFADVAALGEDLGPDQLRRALWRSQGDLDVLLSPPPERAMRIEEAELRLVVEAASGAAEAVVLHLGRSLDPAALAAVEIADRVLEIVELDVASFRAASRVLEAFAGRRERRPDIVVNKAGRSEITPGDVRRVFGEPALAVLPRERAARAARERGRLLPARSRMARRFDRLAAALVEGSAPEPPPS
jgi:Flp pilus assembly CpaE family ATPase